MSHTNLIVPVVLIISLLYGIVFCALKARDVWDDIGARTDRYLNHPVLAYVLMLGSFVMIILFARLLIDTIAFVTNQLLA